MLDMDRPGGYSIDDVDMMVMSLDEWRAAERRMMKRSRQRGEE